MPGAYDRAAHLAWKKRLSRSACATTAAVSSACGLPPRVCRCRSLCELVVVAMIDAVRAQPSAPPVAGRTACGRSGQAASGHDRLPEHAPANMRLAGSRVHDSYVGVRHTRTLATTEA